MTAVGYRPFPSVSEVRAALAGAAPRFARPPPGPLGDLPVLVTAEWCLYTVPVARSWQEVAGALGVRLRILDAESDDGGRFMDAAEVAGVPCTVGGPGRLIYGFPPAALDARRFFVGERGT
jgi:hypothetical protein